MLSSDLDVLEEVLDGYRGPLKIQLCGPWTLAATLELPRTMNVAIADPGAVADLTASLAEGAAAHAAEVAKRVPGRSSWSSSTSPRCPRVAAGEVPTASGLSRLAAVEDDAAAGAAGAGARGATATRSCTAALHGPVRANQSGGGRWPSPSTSASYGGGRKTAWPRRRRPGRAC